MEKVITIPKKEYQELTEKAFLYEYLRQTLREDIFLPPPTRDASQIIKEFKKTKRYNKKFLSSLTKGLRYSSYFK